MQNVTIYYFTFVRKLNLYTYQTDLQIIYKKFNWSY